MENSDDLKKLAAWYRHMSQIGHSDSCASRKQFAEYLERRARELEQAGEPPAAAHG